MPAITFPVRNQWDPNLAMRVNTSAIVLPGRGETPRSYQRFGARLAYDTFDVTVFDPADLYEAGNDPVELAASIGARADESGTTHLVVIGHDVGANLALQVALHLGSRLTALVLSSPARRALAGPVDWSAELALRSGCPGYTGQLDADPQVRRGALSVAPDVLPPIEPLDTITAPVLLLTGSDDPLADEELLKELRSTLPRVTSVEVRGGKRDTLNDKTSRSVSGEIVKFVEWARSGDLDQPLLRYLA